MVETIRKDRAAVHGLLPAFAPAPPPAATIRCRRRRLMSLIGKMI